MLIDDRTPGRTFIGVRLFGGFYVGITVRRYLYSMRVFLVWGASTVQLLGWKVSR